MPPPLVTIGISYRNPGRHFRLAIQSVFAQTFTDWELLLVDDGSTDGALDFVKSLVDSRVRSISDGHSRNLNIRLNQMVALARGRFFFRMDADDIMSPRRVARQLEVLTASGENTVVGSAAWSIDEDSKIVGRHRIDLSRQFVGFEARHSFVHPTVAARTDWFLANPYSESFVFHRSQDAELWCRTSKHTTFINIQEPLLYYREGSVSYPNYLGTTLGILALTRTYARTRGEFLWLSAREMAKCWITTAAIGLQKDNFILRRRFVAISPEEKTAGEKDLARVESQELPVGSLAALKT